MKDKRDAFSECNPILSFLYFIIVIVTTMLINHPIVLGLSFLGALCYQISLSGIRKALKYQLCYIPFLIIVAMINPAFNHYGVTVLFYLETGPVTVEAMIHGIVLACMLWTALLWFANVNKVMTTDKYVYLFGKVTPALSLVLSMVFRLIPRYRKRLKVVRDGQKCLGKGSNEKNTFSKIRSGINEISMLVTWALENGMDTADSMRARGYGVGRRTAYAVYRFTRKDGKIAIIGVILYLLAIAGFSKGSAFSQYNPQIIIGGLPFVWESIVTYILWLGFAMLPVALQIYEKYRQEIGICRFFK